MKKFLLLLSLVSVCFISNAQSDTSRYVTNSNTEKLVDKYIDKVESSITAIAQSLKQPAEHVYKILIKQQSVKSWVRLFTLPILAIFVLSFFYSLKYSKWDEGPDNDAAGLCIISGILSIITFIALICFLETIITGLINPEYGAIQEILSVFK